MPNLNSPILTGDVSGGLHSTKVEKLQNQPVSATAPTTGQTLLWTGTAWAPSTPSSGGGGGANGLTYYLRQDVDADAPTTNLPGTPKQLGRTGAVAQTSITSGTLTNGVWTLLGGYVSESVPLDPNTGSIPGGLWDLNLWALGTANQQSPTLIRAKVYTYNGTDAPTLLATSGEQIINTVSAQYSVSVLVPQTTVQLTTRIYIAIEVQASANNHTATLQFGDGTPSHVHTSLPLVGGTGLWHSVAGVLQPNASLLVDADVDAAAAIAQSKIANLTTDLGNKAAQAQVDVYATAGTFTWTKPAGAKAVHVALLSGGGGGGSGRKTPSGTAGAGGGGGMGGGYSERILQAGICGSTETVTVGAGGTGGATITTNPVGGTNGNPGVVGGNSSFGTLVVAFGGQPGAGGTTTSGGGGAASNSTRAMFPGSTGGAGALAGGASGGTSGNSATGGGGGGGVAATPAAANGGTGGTSGYFLAGGQAVLGIAPGGNGGTNINVAANQAAGGGGGGGGASSITGNAGNGGAGGSYGGGGGGGGASLLDVGNSGAGGAGASGIVVVTTYF
jgi:hypothetical protein